jgi:hypothetical protein
MAASRRGAGFMDRAPSKEEAVRLALAELGDAPAAEVVALVERKYGLRIDPRFLPVFKATFRAREQLEEARARAKALTAEYVKAAPSQPT